MSSSVKTDMVISQDGITRTDFYLHVKVPIQEDEKNPKLAELKHRMKKTLEKRKRRKEDIKRDQVDFCNVT